MAFSSKWWGKLFQWRIPGVNVIQSFCWRAVGYAGSPENISSVFQDAGQQSHHTVPCSWDMNLGNLTASKSGYFPCTSIRILTQVSALILEPWMFNRVNQSVTQLFPSPTWDSVISGLLNQLPLSNLLTSLPILLFIFFFSCPDMFFPLKKSFCCFKGGFGV